MKQLISFKAPLFVMLITLTGLLYLSREEHEEVSSKNIKVSAKVKSECTGNFSIANRVFIVNAGSQQAALDLVKQKIKDEGQEKCSSGDCQAGLTCKFQVRNFSANVQQIGANQYSVTVSGEGKCQCAD
jgi:hypothetical protein